MKLLRAGITGFGKMGRLRAQLVNGNDSMKLVAIADPNVSPSDIPRGCKYFSDYRDLLKEHLDALFVCTPNFMTPRVIIDALNAGCHVFSEKPPGRNVEDVLDIMECERKHPRLKVKFGFNHRYHESVMDALGIVSSGQLGRLLWMRGVYGKSGESGFDKNWRSDYEIAGGGILLDQGIHMLDLFRAFCGDFEEIKSFVGNGFWNFGVEDNAFALLRNDQNQVAMLHSSATQWKHKFSLELFLSDGYLAVQGFQTSSKTYGRESLTMARRQFGSLEGAGNPREEISYYDADQSWEREIDEFVSSIEKDAPIAIGTSTDALKAMEMVYRIYDNDEAWRNHLRNLKSLDK